MSRYIIIPEPAKFIDPGSKKTAVTTNEDGEVVPLPDRDHEWFMHVYILSHLQFGMEAGGGEATRAAAEIARSLGKAVAADEHFYEVSDDNLRRIKCCYARASDEDYQAVRDAEKGKADPRTLAKSSLGLTRPMDNFTSVCFQDHFDALDNATTTKPEPIPVATVAVG